MQQDQLKRSWAQCFASLSYGWVCLGDALQSFLGLCFPDDTLLFPNKLEETASVLVSLASVFSQVATLLLTTVVRASEATGNAIGFQTLNQPKGRKDTQQVSKHLPPADSSDCRGSLCFDLCLPTFFPFGCQF